jgi:hypothetical protein
MKTLRGRMPLTPYFPALVILAGAMVVAVGGFWAAARQATFNARLNEKNNEIITLQNQQILAMTGGNSYPYILPAFSGKDTLDLMLLTEGKYTVYDLQVTILNQNLFSALVAESKDVAQDISEIQNRSQTVLPIIAALGPNRETTVASYKLDHNEESHKGFLIILDARNGHFVELIRMYWLNNWWSVAYKVISKTGVLKEEIAANFPKKQSEEIRKWR